MTQLQSFVRKMEAEKIPCFIFLVKDKENKVKFIEVIVKRPYRYTEKSIMKRIPKRWKGIKVKAI